MKQFIKRAGIIALLTTAVFVMASCDAVKDFIDSEYPEFPKELRATWKKDGETRIINSNMFKISHSTYFLLSKITGDNYSLRTPAGSGPEKNMTKTLKIINGSLEISGCTESSCGGNCNGTWTK